jgi:hypothetical protein
LSKALLQALAAQGFDATGTAVTPQQQPCVSKSKTSRKTSLPSNSPKWQKEGTQLRPNELQDSTKQKPSKANDTTIKKGGGGYPTTAKTAS